MTFSGSSAFASLIASGHGDARAAVERKADLVSQHVLHRLDALDDVSQSALGHQSAVYEERSPALDPAAGLRAAVGEVGDLLDHARVERDAHLDDGEALRRGLHHPHVVGVVVGGLSGEREPDAAVVDHDAVADLAAEQLVHRDAGGLAGDVPQGDLDGADGRAPGLEAAEAADPPHDALDVGRVLADDVVAVEEDVGFQVGLGPLGLPEAVDALVRGDPDDGVAADDGALQVGDLHCRLLVRVSPPT